MEKRKPIFSDIEVRKEERRHHRVNRLFQAIFGLTVLTQLVAGFSSYLGTGVFVWTGYPTTRLLLVVGVIGFLLSRQWLPERFLSKAGQMFVASVVVMVGLWWVSLRFTANQEELGRVATIITAIIGVILITQTVPQRYMSYMMGAVAAMTLLLTFVDLYWPEPRPILSVQNRAAAYVLVALAAVLLVAIILRDFQEFSLQAKLVGTTLFLTMLIVGITTYAVGAVIRQTIEEQARERLHVLTQTQALALGELLARQVNTLQALSFNVLLQNAAEAQTDAYAGSEADIIQLNIEKDSSWIYARDEDPLIQRYLNNVVADELQKYIGAFPENAEVFVTDRYGALVAATGRTSDYYQGDEVWWEEVYNSGFGGVFVDTPDFDQSSNVLGLAIAVPVFSNPESGEVKEFVGVLRTTYRLDALVDFLGAVDLGDEGKLDLYFADGTSLRVVENEISFQVATIPPDRLVELLPQNETVVVLDYENISSLVTRYPVSTLSGENFVGDLQWYVVSAEPELVANAPVTAQQRTNILLGVGAVIIGGVAATYVGRVLTAPIIQLTEAAARITRGDLQAQVTVSSRDEIGVLSAEFNTMTQQLRDAIANLEQRVVDRTRALNISTEVGRRLSTILDSQHLVAETVQQVRLGFDYYHAHMYLFDKTKKQLLMVGGTGQAGETMLVSGHKIAIGQGLVGRAAATNLPIIAPNVENEPGWLANPLLPETKAEVAVPIAIGEEVIGVLDIQHNVVNGLQQQDADLLLSIANQVAIALQNARLLQDAHQRVERLAQVTQVKAQIQNETTIEGALQVAVRELGRLTGAPQTTVRLQSNGHRETPLIEE